MRDRKNLVILALIVATGILFWSATHFEFLNWDDPDLVTEHPWFHPLRWASVLEMWSPLSLWNGIALDFSPVRDMTYALDWLLWGMSGPGFHRTEVLFHAVNAGLLALFFSHFMRFRYAVLAAACWAWHPLVVEPTAWVSGRKDVVLFFFFLLALLAFIRGNVWLGLALGVSAILSKYPAATIGLLIFLPIWPEGSRGVLKRPGKIVGGILLLIGCALVVFSTLANQHAGKLVNVDETGWWYRNWPAGFQVVTHAFTKGFLPIGLNPRYVQEPGLGLESTKVLIGVFLALAVVFLIAVLKSRKPALASPLIFGAVTFLPYLPIVPHQTWMADRYLYLSLIALPWFFALLFQTLEGRRFSRLGWVTLFAVAVLLAWGTHQRLPVWRNSFSLWSDTIQKSPQLYYVWGNYGSALLEAGDAEGAWRAFEKGMARNSRWVEGHAKLSQAFLALGDVKRAREELERFEKSADEKTKESEMRLRTVLWAELGDAKFAEGLFKEFLETRPGDPMALANYGVFLARTGREERARALWERATRLDPRHAAARLNLARYWFRKKDCRRMAEELREIRRAMPADRVAIRYLQRECGAGSS